MYLWDTPRTHGYAFHSDVRNVLKGPITPFKVLLALPIRENVHNLVCELFRFQLNQVAKMARLLLLITIITKFLMTCVLGF